MYICLLNKMLHIHELITVSQIIYLNSITYSNSKIILKRFKIVLEVAGPCCHCLNSMLITQINIIILKNILFVSH